MLKEDRSCKEKILPVLSNRVKKQLEKKERLKKDSVGGLKVRGGGFTVSFD
tara:strand:- start:661 stop:813 length:153 start_codon:yes stop_codon:yes gene_type:complete